MIRWAQNLLSGFGVRALNVLCTWKLIKVYSYCKIESREGILPNTWSYTILGANMDPDVAILLTNMLVSLLACANSKDRTVEHAKLRPSVTVGFPSSASSQHPRLEVLHLHQLGTCSLIQSQFYVKPSLCSPYREVAKWIGSSSPPSIPSPTFGERSSYPRKHSSRYI